MNTNPKTTYTNYELKRALTGVFRSAWFDDLDVKLMVQDSYFNNFYQLVEYARANNLDAMEYIKSIRDYLPPRKNKAHTR